MPRDSSLERFVWRNKPLWARQFVLLKEMRISLRVAARRDWDRECKPSDQSPIRSISSHWRNSPLKPMLSAIWKLAMTHRSICLPDLPAVSQHP